MEGLSKIRGKFKFSKIVRKLLEKLKFLEFLEFIESVDYSDVVTLGYLN